MTVWLDLYQNIHWDEIVWDENNDLQQAESEVKKILQEILVHRDFHPLQTMAEYELQWEIIERIHNDNYFAWLLLWRIDSNTIMNAPKYILEALRNKSVENLKHLEDILIDSPHYDFIWKNFIKNGYFHHWIDFE